MCIYFLYLLDKVHCKDLQRQCEVPNVTTESLQLGTLVPAVGAYSRDSGLTGIVSGLCMALGISPVSGAPYTLAPWPCLTAGVTCPKLAHSLES